MEGAGKPDWVRVSREIDGGETTAFKALFKIFDPPRRLDVAADAVRA